MIISFGAFCSFVCVSEERSHFQNNNRKVFIAAAQQYDEIYKKILNVRGNTNNIVCGLIV